MAATALPYETHQWSPFNKNGRKVYSKLFLLALKNDPKSNEIPNNIPASILINNTERVNKNKPITAPKKKSQTSKLSPIIENSCSNDDDDLILFNQSDPSIVENRIVIPVDKKKYVPKAKRKQNALKTEFNLDYVTDDVFNDKKLESKNNMNKDPVGEVQDKNKLSGDDVSKSILKLNNVLVVLKNPPEQSRPPVLKLDTDANAVQGADDVHIARKPSSQTMKSAGVSNSHFIAPPPPAMNRVPARELIQKLQAGNLPINIQTPQTVNYKQGQAIFTPIPASFGPVPLPSPMHTAQYYNSSPINYVHPAYPMQPTQPNVYQHSQQRVVAGTSIKTCNSMNVLEEYLNSNLSIEDVEQKVKASTPPPARQQLITDGYLSVLETSRTNRLQTGYLFGKLVKSGVLSVEEYCASLEVILKTSDELAVDVPRVWDYVAELVFPVLCEGAIETRNLHKLFNLLVLKPHAAKLLTRLFKLMITVNEENGSLSFADYTAMASNALKIQSSSALKIQSSSSLKSQSSISFFPIESIPELQPPSQLHEILEKYLGDRYSVQECLQHIKTSISPSEISQLVSIGTMSVLKKSKMSRLRTGFLFLQLLKLNILSISNYCVGLENIFKQADQLVIEIPRVWCCIAEIMSPAICDNAITLRDLHNLFKLLGRNNHHASELLNFLFKFIIQEKGVPFLETIWSNSSLTFGDFMDESKVLNYIKQHNLQFLLKIDDLSPSPSPSTLFANQSGEHKNKISSIMDESLVTDYSGDGANSKTPLQPIASTTKMAPALEKSIMEINATLSLGRLLQAESQSNIMSKLVSSASMIDVSKVAPIVLDSSEIISDELECRLQLILEGIKTAITTSSLSLGSQNLVTSLNEVESLSIDSMQNLERVVDLVFQKAVNDPDFSVAYALFCRRLVLLKTPAGDGKTFVKFRSILEIRCELEFEKHFVLYIPQRARKIKEIEECGDIEKKKNMQLDFDKYDKSLRLKSVGLVTFIGELFKQGMLLVNIIVQCLNRLRDQGNDVSLECVCQILLTVGKELESRKVDLNHTFNVLSYIVVNSESISNGVRLMMKKVIDLRAADWVPKRKDAKKDQIQEQAQQIQASDTQPPDENHDSEQSYSYDKEVCDKLRELFKSGSSWCEMKVWIIQNVGERAKEDQFIRTLATACFEDSVDNLKLKTTVLQKKYALLLQFVKKNPTNELKCLHALQAFMDRLQHPPGLLLAICSQLYNEHIFSQRSFLDWKASNDFSRQEGKFKPMKQLSSFFAGLNKNGGDSSSSDN